MTAIFSRRLSAMLLGVLALAIVGLFASKALACSPEGYVEALRVEGELPGGG